VYSSKIRIHKTSINIINPFISLNDVIETKVELENSKSVQRILDKMDKKFDEVTKKFDEVNKKFDETNKKIDDSKIETNSKIDLANKKIDSVEADLKLLKAIGAALGAIAAFVISSNLNTFIQDVFFGGK
jgi:tetrahydromethanopterin S-methyltransferase subunit G